VFDPSFLLTKTYDGRRWTTTTSEGFRGLKVTTSKFEEFKSIALFKRERGVEVQIALQAHQHTAPFPVRYKSNGLKDVHDEPLQIYSLLFAN